MNEEIKRILSYKSKKDLTVEDIETLKNHCENKINAVLAELENLTGREVYVSPFTEKDDLGNTTIKIKIQI